MPLRFRLAEPDDAPMLAALMTSVAARLTSEHGPGRWSSPATERGVLYCMRSSRMVVAQEEGRIVATFRLTTKKPWAIDTAYFTRCRRPLYLLDMAVEPGSQRVGVGRACLAEAASVAREWPADALRLDAYDAPAGAGGFYARCGFTEVARVTYRGTPLVYFEQLLAPVPGESGPSAGRGR